MGKLMQQGFSKAGYNITIEQWIIIVNLMRYDGQFQQQLANNTYKDKSSVTRMVAALQRQGLVKRTPDQDDRRQKRIFLTDKGRELFKRLKPLALKTQKQATREIKAEDIEFCKNILVKIHDNITGS
jgi:DNA-binding MarR family transcriptional regulator